MFTCVVCRFAVELDDVELRRGTLGCVCTRCYARLVENEKPMPKDLRRELTGVLAAVA